VVPFPDRAAGSDLLTKTVKDWKENPQRGQNAELAPGNMSAAFRTVNEGGVNSAITCTAIPTPWTR
jgi:hypothetical protein